MPNPFFDRPVLNSPYEYPIKHWELDTQGQPTQQITSKAGGRPSSSRPFPSPASAPGKSAQAEPGF